MIDSLLAALFTATVATAVISFSEMIASALNALVPQPGVTDEWRGAASLTLLCSSVIFVLLLHKPSVLLSPRHDRVHIIVAVVFALGYGAIRFRSFLRVVRNRQANTKGRSIA